MPMADPVSIFAVTGNAVARFMLDDPEPELALEGSQARCIAVDPRDPLRVYVGTMDRGLWFTADGGASWRQAGPSIDEPRVLSVAVSRSDRRSGVSVVYAGTEPSNLSERPGSTTTPRPTATPTSFSRTRSRQSACTKPPDRDRPLGRPRRHMGAARRRARPPLRLGAGDRPRRPGSLVRRGQPLPVRRPRRRRRAGGLLRSRGNGWETVDGWGDSVDLRRMPYALVTLPDQPGRLLAGLRGGTLLITDDAGRSWARLPVTLPDVIDLTAATA